MVKSVKGLPAFLKAQLSSKRKELVRKQYPLWVANAKATFGEELVGSMEVTHHFMKYMARKDSGFKGVKLEVLRVNQPGTSFIHDYVRKHLGKHDEKPATPTPP